MKLRRRKQLTRHLRAVTNGLSASTPIRLKSATLWVTTTRWRTRAAISEKGIQK